MSESKGKVNKEKLEAYQAKKQGFTEDTRTYASMLKRAFLRNKAASKIKHVRYIG
jgi:hypothetical protein